MVEKESKETLSLLSKHQTPACYDAITYGETENYSCSSRDQMAEGSSTEPKDSELTRKTPGGESEVNKRQRYPLAVIFIVGNEFCERFSYYGMRAVLTLYFRQILLYSENTATQAFHIFAMGCYFTPVFGAIIADSFLGRFKTIFYISILYAAGNVLLSYASYLEQATMSMIALAFIAIGTGGIKPCVSAFGGDQFLPGQEAQLSTFFSIFYFAINAGSLVSTIITPIFREDINCSRSGNGCFPLAFGVPALLMLVAVVLFLVGRPLYRVIPPAKGNVVVKFLGCTLLAFFRKLLALLTFRSNKKNHWLYYADDKYDPKLIEDTKAVMKVLFLYLPLPAFWALFDQQGSRWTLQATRMNGDLFNKYRIKPDQMQVVNAMFIIVMIPLFEYIVYPICKKIGILTTPLQRITVGGLLAALAFVFAAMLDFTIEQYMPVLPAQGKAQLTVVNGGPCTLLVQLPRLNNQKFLIGPLEMQSFNVPSKTDQILDFSTAYGTNCLNVGMPLFDGVKRTSINVSSADRATSNVYVAVDASGYLNASFSPFMYEKPTDGASVTIFYDLSRSDISDKGEKNVTFRHVGEAEISTNVTLPSTAYGVSKTKTLTLHYSNVTYEVYLPVLGSRSIGSFFVGPGGSYYVVILVSNASVASTLVKAHEVIPPNQVHILWQIVQYVTITAGEIMFSITGLEFSYSEAPLSMKSVLQAAWLLTVAFGNLLVVLVTKYVKLEKQAYEFLFFAALMALDMFIFALMARFYIYGYKEGEEANATGSPKVSSKEANAAPPIEEDQQQSQL